MFFAVASSAFILRARMACPTHTTRIIKRPVVIDVSTRAPSVPANSAASCGTAAVQTSADGGLVYTFVPCPTWSIELLAEPAASEAATTETGPHTIKQPNAVEGVLVDAIDGVNDVNTPHRKSKR